MPDQESITTAIWLDEDDGTDLFSAQKSWCHGYDVYGQALTRASYPEYLYLLLTGERPSAAQARVVERTAIALANPGPREASVRAAMNAGVGGSTAASSLIAALSVGAGSYGGARELYLAMLGVARCGQDLQAWRDFLPTLLNEWRQDLGTNPEEFGGTYWPEPQHTPGFEPHAEKTSLRTLQYLDALPQSGSSTAWLQRHLTELEAAVESPISLVGVTAFAWRDIGLSAEQGEYLYLILRLPGAAAHALEQGALGWRRYPFFRQGIVLRNDPGPVGKEDKA